MLEIDFNKKNLDKCLCLNCPVQKDSSCVKDQEVPKLYCATGKSKCGDLKSHEECQCPKCDVWMENDSEVRRAPAYFCINGRAVECCKIVSDDDERDSKLRELRRSYYTPI